MFNFVLDKFKKWFNYITSPIEKNDSYLEELEEFNKLIPESFVKIHSSRFNNYTVYSYKKTLYEYNDMVFKALIKKPKDFKPKDFSYRTVITVSEYFLKDNAYVDEIKLIENFLSNNKKIVEWLIEFEENVDYDDTDCKYLYFKNLFKSNKEILSSLLHVQEEILINF